MSKRPRRLRRQSARSPKRFDSAADKVNPKTQPPNSLQRKRLRRSRSFARRRRCSRLSARATPSSSSKLQTGAPVRENPAALSAPPLASSNNRPSFAASVENGDSAILNLLLPRATRTRVNPKAAPAACKSPSTFSSNGKPSSEKRHKSAPQAAIETPRIVSTPMALGFVFPYF